MVVNINKISKIAADWWVSRLDYTEMNNGDPVVSALASKMLSKRTPLSEEVKESIKDKIREGVYKTYSLKGSCYLQVDYDPQGDLYIFLKDLSLPMYTFPCKTSMLLKDGNILVSEGYGSEQELIYSSVNK